MTGKYNKHGGNGAAGSKAFVVSDRKQVPNKAKPLVVPDPKQTNKPKQSTGKPFVIPDRKIASTTKDTIISTKNNDNKVDAKKRTFQPRKAWWEKEVSDMELIKFEEGQAWHGRLPAFVKDADPRASGPDSHSVKLQGDRLAAATKTINSAYQQQMKLYADHLKNSTEMKSDLKWMNDMIRSGTMSDKVAAMALKVQGSPFHELDTLDILMATATRKEQRGAQLAMEALKDLFVNNLLPDRPLRSLENNILNHAEMNITTALLSWFESQIRSRYEKLLEALESGLNSNIDFFKRECLQTVSELLIGKPEQESRLLAMLVNKLGDPSRATCSKAIEVLKLVMRSHPAMKIVIVREVRQFLYRPNLKIRPVFNGIILLSQVQLTSKADHAVAVQLVEGYLSLFEKTMKEEEYGSRLLSALLTGINKALPYLQSTESLDKYVDPLFRIVHTAASFSTATQALMLLSHLALGHGRGPSSEDVATESAIVKRYYRALYAKLLSEQITTRSRNTLFLNLLYRSIKGDTIRHRALAFIKRLLICASQSVPAIAGGLLFLISEILKARPELKSCLADVPETATVSTVSKDTNKNEDDGEAGFIGNFNVLKREPEFAYAADALPTTWEMTLLNRHFHPSVTSFAASLMEAPSHHIEYAGDPTVEFSLMSFLNRFAYKNPKKATTDKIQHHRTSTEEPVNVTMAQQTADSVDPDKQFFYKYFTDKQQLVAEGRSRNKSKQKADDAEDGSEDGDSDSDDGRNAAQDSDVESNAGEDEIDRYADKLAEQLMRSAGNDIDDFDFSDEGEDDDEGSAVGELDDVAADSSDDEEGLDFDQGLEGSDSDESDSDDMPAKKTSSKKKSAVEKGSSQALDFADFVAEQQAQGKTDTKQKKGKKTAQKDDNDNSDDGYTGLVAYGDEDGEGVAMDAVESDSGGESLLGDDDDSASEGEDVSFDGTEDDSDMDMDMEEGDSDGSDSEEDDFDSAEEEALENAGFADSDTEMNMRGRNNKKGKFEKKSRSSSSSAFASAEDYEDMMEDIVRKVSRPAAGTTIDAPAVVEENKTKAGKGKVAKSPAPVAVVSNKKRKDVPVAVDSSSKGQKKATVVVPTKTAPAASKKARK